ncbi:uncharacterized protein F5891DRAFT_981834 [Suillus fuscotomentosus]|uniref:Uncharacterized protein n=1 Tax=Suillus fuscotomentosus TaxID=1912939 RepID=A0AAD4E2B6_9AGAM|nr:uncharacterized protein F5891DRAFT_981834 [Suillus fuscotomentosus]KAG1898435.1 hypothetical protein F5891DRAFT_981834 [Suillus fuscotomentosus]
MPVWSLTIVPPRELQVKFHTILNMAGDEIGCDTSWHITLILWHFRGDVPEVSHASKMNGIGEDSAGNQEIAMKLAACGFARMAFLSLNQDVILSDFKAVWVVDDDEHSFTSWRLLAGKDGIEEREQNPVAWNDDVQGHFLEEEWVPILINKNIEYDLVAKGIHMSAVDNRECGHSRKSHICEGDTSHTLRDMFAMLCNQRELFTDVSHPAFIEENNIITH